MPEPGLWRLIDSGPCDAAYNMALDEAISKSVIALKAPPTLRLYGWQRPALSIGRFQRAEDVNWDYCETSGIPVVRRPTGGRAILHGPELTYSFSASAKLAPFGQGLFDSYAAISRAFMKAFASMALHVSMTERKSSKEEGGDSSPLCFSSPSFGEITLEGKKIIGSAQRRWPSGILQQGSIPLSVLREETEGALRDTNGTRLLTGLCELMPSLDTARLRDAVLLGFEDFFRIRFRHSSPTQDETATAGQLVREKYGDHGWTRLR